MPELDNQPGHLSVHRDFVVQFDTHTDVEHGHLTGRVEHVVSGQAIQFHSLETMLAFMAQLLQTSHRTVEESDRRGRTHSQGLEPGA